MNNKLRLAISSVALLLATSGAHASLVNSISGGTLVAIPVTNTLTISKGPITQAPGITWSSTVESTYGYDFLYGFGENGVWQGLPMVGLNFSDGTMTYSFANTLSAVGGFINYVQFGDKPQGAAPTIAIYDSADQLIESAILNFNTGGGENSGFFYGFEIATSSIAYFKLSNASIGLANLTIREGTPSAVPLPAALPLLLSGLGVLGFMTRRKVV